MCLRVDGHGTKRRAATTYDTATLFKHRAATDVVAYHQVHGVLQGSLGGGGDQVTHHNVVSERYGHAAYRHQYVSRDLI